MWIYVSDRKVQSYLYFFKYTYFNSCNIYVKVYKEIEIYCKGNGVTMCGLALFILFAHSVFLGVNCSQKDNTRKMSWHYYDETEYAQVCYFARAGLLRNIFSRNVLVCEITSKQSSNQFAGNVVNYKVTKLVKKHVLNRNWQNESVTFSNNYILYVDLFSFTAFCFKPSTSSDIFTEFRQWGWYLL